MKTEIDKMFWFCPVCGKTANMYKALNGIKQLDCLTCHAVTEIKRVYRDEIQSYNDRERTEA